ncbi:MAG: LUD domain-containing protein [Anaerolineales bacterium]
MAEKPLTINPKYAQPASDEQITRTAQALEAHGFQVFITANGEEARRKVFELIPPGSEVFTATSRTLDSLNIPSEVDQRYNSVRVRLATMNRQTQMREMIKLGAVPEYIIGSVHAVTESGSVMIASNTGSQLAGYAASAAHVIWVVGVQKIVPTLEEAFKRIEEYCLPLEDQRAMQVYNMHSNISKILIVHREVLPGRTTIILVKENLGF